MILQSSQISSALDEILATIGRAATNFDEAQEDGPAEDWLISTADWNVELSYAKLLALSEILQLPTLRSDIALDYAEAKKEGFRSVDHDPDGFPHLKWLGPARKYHAALECVAGVTPSRTVTKDLESIIRAATYSITDKNVFKTLPSDENDVHLRLEAVLKCVFPDLKHKPTLTKPIKNFEPDTGIPSIQTLIEYKYVSSKSQIGQITDQLLADTRGYTSPEWSSFVYVIYETNRFRPEHEWRQMLRACLVSEQSSVIVISGEPLTENDRSIARRTIPAKASAA